MATQLPIVDINGTQYFRDDRLREFRNVNDVQDRIRFDDPSQHIVVVETLGEETGR